jgi:hypothetical protein
MMWMSTKSHGGPIILGDIYCFALHVEEEIFLWLSINIRKFLWFYFLLLQLREFLFKSNWIFVSFEKPIHQSTFGFFELLLWSTFECFF